MAADRVVALAVAHSRAPAPTPGAGGAGHSAVAFWTVFGTVAGALGLAGVAALSVKQLITPSLKRAGTSAADVLYDYLAVLRSRSLRRIRRYQRSVGEYAREHTLGFGTEPISVRDVYVPLAAEGTGEHRDLYEEVRRQRRTVVIGEAGAGKSMLLKHSLLEWAERHTNRRSEMPALVELRRLNSVPADAIDLVAQVRDFMELHRFKGAAGFVTKALEDGRISVLFDGLDEVTADRLDDVVQKLKDFAQRFSDCQIVVTCRSSLYEGDLEFRTVVRVAELDDATIRRLLHRWPGLDTASEERLYRNLGSTPTLKRLARSPLLLSMMAWMTTTGIVLPTSRAEFYDTAIENLVKRDDVLKRGRSRFAANKKLAVLRGIALILQDRFGGDEDRLNISHARALDYIRSIAASIDLDEKDAEALLTEIVDRSELLATSGGVAPSYFFRHLTFQEYLAALELRDDRDGLLARYTKDQNAWQETVKLWCGKADRDATPLIRYLLDRGTTSARTMALECASVTTRVDETIVREIVDLLGEDLVDTSHKWANTEVVRAFGNAAAGSGPRSALIRDHLFDLVRRESRPSHAVVAMSALALSGHDSAAEFLAATSSTHGDSARVALRSMGDLAVATLRLKASSGEVSAVDDLAIIGTPSAIEGLVLLLTYADDVGVRAAWRLAERLDDAVVAETIAQIPMRMPVDTTNTWVWERFSEGSAVSTVVVGRIFELITTCADDQTPRPTPRIDFRLVVAAVVVDRKGPWLPLLPADIDQLVEQVLGQEGGSYPALTGTKSRLETALSVSRRNPSGSRTVSELQDALFEHYQLQRKHVLLIRALHWDDRMSILALLASEHRREKWTTISAATSEEPRSLVLVSTIWMVVGLYAAGTAAWRDIGILVGHWPYVQFRLLVGSWIAPALVWYCLPLSFAGRPALVVRLIRAVRKTALAAAVGCQLLIAVVSTARWIGWLPTWILVGIGLPTYLLWRHAVRRNQRYLNPLRRAIEEARTTSGSTSIIAAPATPQPATPAPATPQP